MNRKARFSLHAEWKKYHPQTEAHFRDSAEDQNLLSASGWVRILVLLKLVQKMELLKLLEMTKSCSDAPLQDATVDWTPQNTESLDKSLQINAIL